jgi:hypothetical protein
MTPTALLAHLRAHAYQVVVEGEVLRVGPADRLTEELRTAIRVHKAALVALLTAPPADPFAALRADLAAGRLAGLSVIHLPDGSSILDVAAYTRQRLADLDDPQLAVEAARRLRRLQAALVALDPDGDAL